MTDEAKGLDALWCKIRIQSEMNDGGKMIGWREREKKITSPSNNNSNKCSRGARKEVWGDH